MNFILLNEHVWEIPLLKCGGWRIIKCKLKHLDARYGHLLVLHC